MLVRSLLAVFLVGCGGPAFDALPTGDPSPVASSTATVGTPPPVPDAGGPDANEAAAPIPTPTAAPDAGPDVAPVPSTEPAPDAQSTPVAPDAVDADAGPVSASPEPSVDADAAPATPDADVPDAGPGVAPEAAPAPTCYRAPAGCRTAAGSCGQPFPEKIVICNDYRAIAFSLFSTYAQCQQIGGQWCCPATNVCN